MHDIVVSVQLVFGRLGPAFYIIIIVPVGSLWTFSLPLPLSLSPKTCIEL